MGFQKTFNGKVEALRGVAALVVAFAHSMAVLQLDRLPAFWGVPFRSLPGWESRLVQLLQIPFNAGNAVILFFTMSGYVLCLSLSRGSGDTEATGHFYLRRLFRIYPAFLVSLAAFFVVRRTVHLHINPAVFSDWTIHAFGPQVTLADFFQDLTLCKFNISPVTWTLNVEMAGSLFLPALFFIAIRKDALAGAAALAGLLWISSELQDYCAARFLFSFYAGMIIACDQDRIQESLRRAGVDQFLLPASLVALMAAAPLFTASELLRDVMGTGGAALMVLAVSGPAGQSRMRWLDGKFCHTLGRISYSFYLLHPIALYLVCWALKFVPEKTLLAPPALLVNMLCFACSSTIAFGMALLSHRYVELPMIEWGRSLGRPRGSRAQPAETPLPTPP